MRSLALIRVHARIARRSTTLWLAVVPLTAFATLLAVISPAAPRGGGVDELVFTAQIVAIFTGIAYAAAFADFATAAARLGIDEVEAATPTAPLILRTARVLGAFGVVMTPSLAILIVVGCIQTVGGNPVAVAQAVAIAATVSAPAALLAIALSALAGTLLPRGPDRIVAVLVWFWCVFSTPLIPVPTLNGTVLSLVGDPVAAGLFGAAPIYPPRGLMSDPSGWSAVASLAWQFLLALVLLVAATRVARARRR